MDRIIDVNGYGAMPVTKKYCNTLSEFPFGNAIIARGAAIDTVQIEQVIDEQERLFKDFVP